MGGGMSVLSFTLVFILSAPAAAELCTPVPPHFSAHPASRGAPHTCSQDYPASALHNDEEGDVDIEFFIKADGSVRSPRVRRSSGHPDLDNAAVACVLRFTYRPAIQNGKPVEVPWTTRVL